MSSHHDDTSLHSASLQDVGRRPTCKSLAPAVAMVIALPTQNAALRCLLFMRISFRSRRNSRPRVLLHRGCCMYKLSYHKTVSFTAAAPSSPFPSARYPNTHSSLVAAAVMEVDAAAVDDELINISMDDGATARNAVINTTFVVAHFPRQ